MSESVEFFLKSILGPVLLAWIGRLLYDYGKSVLSRISLKRRQKRLDNIVNNYNLNLLLLKTGLLSYRQIISAVFGLMLGGIYLFLNVTIFLVAGFDEIANRLPESTLVDRISIFPLGKISYQVVQWSIVALSAVVLYMASKMVDHFTDLSVFALNPFSAREKALEQCRKLDPDFEASRLSE